MAIRLKKSMAAPLKTVPVVADKCGNGTAIEISALPACKVEHVSAPIASNLGLYPMAHVERPDSGGEITCHLPRNTRAILGSSGE
ncbi:MULTISPECIES: hypothetical protein [unclassified Mesorhizobium]|uniref:hypothetical protein n=1 Tax=unclassified Mesorhizobium TaxID=325217 RepID=UPI000F760321|nr:MULTISPECIES: hypothetical protein [unclassified Mesorhizobium]AZO24844.1 hypothetical protein EJ070_32055 [Mesorhizobium sp. M1E.F.Ca.ET.045.02.1.1]RUW28240.1 hypothetical protein EOA38_25605 [Mesorhizobium sp. M1E.F.Ca.ET.041.01.1.1]RWD81500.1 MAG: hypothetical protein EOS38_28390 [Mesorhizobium sp.]RWD87910.1 MAG: hypothetical protein EOS39_24265 [Mesorhizobium sp.]TIV50924.1 MAG: hypothetical protein E5V88_18535 [Mesorhizobium sp.]